jgi:hypothetical protein
MPTVNRLTITSRRVAEEEARLVSVPDQGSLTPLKLVVCGWGEHVEETPQR